MLPAHVHLNCSAGTLRWWQGADDAQRVASGEGPAFRHELHAALAGRWVLLVGDSSMRMLYHHLLGLLSGMWELWPAAGGHHFRPGSCFDSSPDMWSEVNTECMEDAWHGGTRLTMVWTKLGAEADLRPLGRLANASVGVPDLVLVGISAWWTFKTLYRGLGWSGSQEEQYARALGSSLAFVEDALRYRRVARLPTNATAAQRDLAALGYFRELWERPPQLVYMAIPNCGRLAPHGTAARLRSLREVSLRVVRNASSWKWFDRELLSSQVCDARVECPGGAGGFAHPAGRALNRYVEVLLQALRPSWPAAPRVFGAASGARPSGPRRAGEPPPGPLASSTAL